MLGHDLAMARSALSGHGLIRCPVTAGDRYGTWAKSLGMIGSRGQIVHLSHYHRVITPSYSGEQTGD